MNAPVLPLCGKIPYRSAGEARQAIKAIKSRGKFIRQYTCKECGEIHLTSRPSRARVKKGW